MADTDDMSDLPEVLVGFLEALKLHDGQALAPNHYRAESDATQQALESSEEEPPPVLPSM